MTDEGSSLRLTAESVRDEVHNYSSTHSNDFGPTSDDGKSRIPMKNASVSDEEEHNYNDMGYGDAAPTIQIAALNDKDKRENRFKVPGPSRSGELSVATADGIGVYEDSDELKGNGEAVRRQGYKRRGSVTRYSIVAQNDVVDEYKAHEDIINRFRRDSLKIESSMNNLSIGSGGDKSENNTSNGSGNKKSGRGSSKPKKGGRGSRKQKDQQVDKDGNAVSRLFRRGRFSLAF
ncbi:hypothetical protein FRACYDRAFT_245127 [Fragilariopsis cylindrus CCMP1102]|uniref:Uncharacterized protein n=1 Tax=Fragilariopsis cylindrus CCMP1102 TaxID=635003 RepID=A0A1E7F1C3_9STRA|nr:hypothetical protein FRACYDRAFT_245127 [Fragilariopsis cylindrus CCMP1102]|eukprot:OEU12001.1 hypothetical protein FRACYDRAFT_245127 [Fragilariopsis cylindrus CCMP1102]